MPGFLFEVAKDDTRATPSRSQTTVIHAQAGTHLMPEQQALAETHLHQRPNDQGSGDAQFTTLRSDFSISPPQ